MARSENEVLASLQSAPSRISSLTQMMQSLSTVNDSSPASLTNGVPLSHSLPIDSDSHSNGHSSPQKPKKKLTFSADAPALAHSVSPPIQIASGVESSVASTPHPLYQRKVGTPTDFRRHITEDEFNRKTNGEVKPVQNSPQRSSANTEEEDVSVSHVNSAQLTSSSPLTSSSVTTKKPSADLTTVVSTPAVEKSVNFVRQVGFNKP